MLRKALGLAALLPLIAPAVPASNLVVNGDFESPLEPAWTATCSGNCTIERATGLDPDPDYEARAALDGAGYARLLQIVEVPDSEVEFSASLRFHVFATGEAWAAAAIVISYLDETQQFLGETRLGAWTRECPWENSSTTHLISLPVDLWTSWTLDINQELAALPSVDPLAVRFLRVGLYAQGFEC